MQSALTKFPYLRPIWQENTEAERLLGVSMTGILGHQVLAGKTVTDLDVVLEELREYARVVNAEWAERLGIPASKAITCVE